MVRPETGGFAEGGVSMYIRWHKVRVNKTICGNFEKKWANFKEISKNIWRILKTSNKICTKFQPKQFFHLTHKCPDGVLECICRTDLVWPSTIVFFTTILSKMSGEKFILSGEKFILSPVHMSHINPWKDTYGKLYTWSFHVYFLSWP